MTKKPPKPPRGGREHDLKCWTEPFEAICDGRKVHEFRLDDRGFEVGDRLLLREFTTSPNFSSGYTCRIWRGYITYISRGPDWGIPEGYCCMSIAPETR